MILYNKVKSTFMVDGEVYKRIRILAIERNMEVSALIEEAMREKLEREYPQYHQQPSPPQTQQQDSITRTAQNRLTKTRDEYAAMEVEKSLAGGKEAIEEQPQQKFERNIHHYKPENSTDKNRTQQSQQQQQPQKYSYSEASDAKQLKEYAFKAAFDLDLSGLEFPANKSKIIESAKRGRNSKAIINALNRIPDKVYKNNTELEGPLTQTYKELISTIDRVKDVNVVLKHVDKKEQPQQQKQQGEELT